MNNIILPRFCIYSANIFEMEKLSLEGFENNGEIVQPEIPMLSAHY